MDKNKKVFMWYKVKQLSETGLNKSQISRELQLDRGTVRKYLSMDESSFMMWINNPRHLPKKLSCYYQYVKDTLEDKPYLSAAQIEDRLKEHFDNLPDVDSKTVYNFVKSIREQHDIKKYKEPRQYQKLPEPQYGEEAQVDFGECHLQTDQGTRKKVYFFTIILSRSRFKYVYFQTLPFTSETASYAHELSFKYFGGYPKKILYDQDKVFLKDENLGDLILTEGFSKFCQKYSFTPVFCRKSDPESKGKIENVVKYVKHNFLKGRAFKDIESLQQECLSWLERTGNAKTHGTTKRIPAEEWIKEKQYLTIYTDTPNKPFSKLPEYTVRKDNTIAYRGNFYSLPFGTYQGQGTIVLLEDKDDTISILSTTNELIANHKSPIGKGVYVRNTDHVRNKSKSLEKTHQNILSDLGSTDKATEYLSALESNKPRHYHDNIRVMLDSVKKAEQKIIDQTLLFCLENNVFNGYRFVEVLEYYKKQSSDYVSTANAVIPRPTKSHDYSNFEPKTSNINFYEEII